MFQLKTKKSYHSVHALKEGVIWLALNTRKPSRTSRNVPKIDEDGIYDWLIDEDTPEGFTDWAKAVRYGAIANCLNMRRVIREQIEPKIDATCVQLAAVERRLERIEQSLADRSPQTPR